MVNTNELLSVAESLPLELKIQLIDKLIGSLSPSDDKVDELWAKEAEKRVAELRSGKVRSIPGEEVFKESKESFSYLKHGPDYL